MCRAEEGGEKEMTANPAGPVSQRGFLGSLFDFGFTSFATPRVIKVLYVLITTTTTLGILGCSLLAFTVNKGLGVVALFVFGPLSLLIVLTVWRIFLEFFMAIFRMSDDIRGLRQDGAMPSWQESQSR
jgi:uncharacterized protein DUF4282